MNTKNRRSSASRWTANPRRLLEIPWYALRTNYSAAIATAGGLPIALPHFSELADAYLDQVQGLVVTGGAFDVDPTLYGDTARHSTVT